MAVSFITFFPYSSGSILYYFIYGCMFCMLPFNFVNYVFFCLFKYSYCYVCPVLGIVSLCSVYCLRVNVYFTTATGCQPNCS